MRFQVLSGGARPDDPGPPDDIAWLDVIAFLAERLLAGELKLSNCIPDRELDALCDLIAAGDVDPDQLRSRPVLDEQSLERLRQTACGGRPPEQQLAIIRHTTIDRVYLRLLERALWERYRRPPWQGRPEPVSASGERVRELLELELAHELRDLRELGELVVPIDRDHVQFMAGELEQRLRRFYGIGGPSVADYEDDGG